MTMRDEIREIKGRIKALAEEQRTDKLKRRECSSEKMSGLWSAVFMRSMKITAHLNFYLTIRGKEYRHATSPATEWAYKIEYEKLDQEFKAEVKL